MSTGGLASVFDFGNPSEVPSVKPTLYVKTGCPWCAEAMDVLHQNGIEYTKIVVTGNPEAMHEMVQLSGQSKAPTMNWAGEVLADFGAEELEQFLAAKGFI